MGCLGREEVGLDILKPGKPPDLLDQLLQFSLPDIAISPLGKFDDLGGHVDERHDQGRYHDEEYCDGHEKSDRIVPSRERFAQFFIDGIERERKDRRPKDGREEGRKNTKNLVDNEGQDADEKK